MGAPHWRRYAWARASHYFRIFITSTDNLRLQIFTMRTNKEWKKSNKSFKCENMEFICYASNIIIYCMQSLYSTAISPLSIASDMLKWKCTQALNTDHSTEWECMFSYDWKSFLPVGKKKDVDYAQRLKLPFAFAFVFEIIVKSLSLRIKWWNVCMCDVCIVTGLHWDEYFYL